MCKPQCPVSLPSRQRLHGTESLWDVTHIYALRAELRRRPSLGLDTSGSPPSQPFLFFWPSPPPSFSPLLPVSWGCHVGSCLWLYGHHHSLHRDQAIYVHILFPRWDSSGMFLILTFASSQSTEHSTTHSRLQQILQPGLVAECGIQRQNSFSSRFGVVGSVNRYTDGERCIQVSLCASLSAGEWGRHGPCERFYHPGYEIRTAL